MDFAPVICLGTTQRLTTVDDAVFICNDGWVRGHCRVTCADTNAFSLDIRVFAPDLPAPLSGNAGNTVGWFKYKDGAADNYAGSVSIGTDLYFTFNADDPTSLSELGTSPSFGITSGDTLAFTFTYRHA